ncbi:MAG: hypothetical protein ACOYT8_04340 [Candidatus Dependentiae bacterium]
MKTTIFSRYSFICKTLFFTSVLKLASFLKVSFVIGSYISFFSFMPMIAPLAGAFNGIASAMLVVGLSFALKIMMGSPISWAFLALAGIPSLMASLVWTRHGRVVAFAVPAICLGLYLSCPQTAISYASLWLIPMALSLKSHNNIFLTSLTSTFVAHAVGAVIWAYSVPMTHAAWVALTPLALVERIIFAAGMSLIYCAIKATIAVVNAKRSIA